METARHRMSDLFKQLGLAHGPEDVAQFIAQHQGRGHHEGLVQAPVWNPSQQAFLNEAIDQDAEWAGVAERLLAALS